MEQPDAGQRLATLDEWALGIERRVSALEKSRDILTDVQITLKELSMQSKYFGEKLDELKTALEKISTENQKQHDDLASRIGTIEKAPAKKWETIAMEVIKYIVIAGIGYLAATLLKAV